MVGYTSSVLKVVLVNPPSPPEFRVSRGLMGGFGMAVNPELLYPPIELAHVAGALLEDGHDVAIIDGDALGVDLDGALARVKEEAPALVVLDSSSTSLDQDLELAGRVREATGALTGMLGSQVTFTPDEIFSGGRIDFVVRGEPEHTVQEVAARAARGEALDGTPGITRRSEDGQVVHEEERAKISDLDALPLEIRLYEADEAAGGTIRTERREGFLLERGARPLGPGDRHAEHSQRSHQ